MALIAWMALTCQVLALWKAIQILRARRALNPDPCRCRETRELSTILTSWNQFGAWDLILLRDCLGTSLPQNAVDPKLTMTLHGIGPLCLQFTPCVANLFLGSLERQPATKSLPVSCISGWQSCHHKSIHRQGKAWGKDCDLMSFYRQCSQLSLFLSLKTRRNWRNRGAHGLWQRMESNILSSVNDVFNIFQLYLLCSSAAWLGIQIRLTPLPFQPSMRPLVGLFGLRAALLKRKREQRHSLPSISIAFRIQVCYLPWWSWCVLELDEDPLNMWSQKLLAMTAVGQYE